MLMLLSCWPGPKCPDLQGQTVGEVFTCEQLDPENEVITILRNIGNSLPVDTVSHHRNIFLKVQIVKASK